MHNKKDTKGLPEITVFYMYIFQSCLCQTDCKESLDLALLKKDNKGS